VREQYNRTRHKVVKDYLELRNRKTTVCLKHYLMVEAPTRSRGAMGLFPYN